jgi:hypothetical protein
MRPSKIAAAAGSRGVGQASMPAPIKGPGSGRKTAQRVFLAVGNDFRVHFCRNINR